MKKSRQFKTVICLALGVVILTGAAFANFDNANGYTLYKNAVKNMIYAENFSASMNMSLEFDGEEVMNTNMQYMFDKNGYTSEYQKSSESEFKSDIFNSERWIQDGKRISRYQNGNYSVSNAYQKGWMSEYTDGSEEEKDFVNKATRFIELACDTFVGDLKNNFVLASSEGGNKTYQVNLRGQQIPEIINAGLSLAFSSMNSGRNYISSYVQLDQELYEAMNPEKFGEVPDGYYESEEFKAAQKKIEEYYEKGYAELERRGGIGIVYVNPDGSIIYYATDEEYNMARRGSEFGLNTEDMLKLLGLDPFIESVNCYITFDENGRILNNRIDGTLSGYDKDGIKHSYVLKADCTIFDYGTTKIPSIDINALDISEDGFKDARIFPVPAEPAGSAEPADAETDEAYVPQTDEASSAEI